MPLLSEEVLLLSLIVCLFIAVWRLLGIFVVRVFVSRLHGKPHELRTKSHAILIERVI